MLAARLATRVNARLHARSEGDWVKALSVLFFFSGFPALIYQLVWQRALFRIFGVNVESVTVVVTAFMIGLGLGSLVGGWLSRQSRLQLLPLLAIIELLTALFGIFSLQIFDRVDTLALGLPLAATAGVTLLLVLVPTLLMGATLPVLVGELSREFGNTGQSMGLLYYVNTLGAAAACLVGLAVLFPFFGMSGSIYIAAAINATVAAGALLAHRVGVKSATAVRETVTVDTPRSAAPTRLAFRHVLFLAALAGFISLSYEIFFFRLQSYASGGSASAFACTLCAFLLGIAGGSRRAGELAAEASFDAAVRGLMQALVVASTAGLLYLPVIDLLAPVPGATLSASLLMVVLIARSWGMVLPFLAYLGIAADRGTGARVSYLYLANIVGSAAGSILTGFVLTQYLPLVGIAQALAVASLICALVLWRGVGGARFAEWRTPAFAAASAAIAVALLPKLAPNLLERLQFSDAALAATPFEKVIENRSGIVTVDSQGTVWGHGMYDGKFNTDLTHDANGVLRPYALSLFHPAPRNVLMIGLASGSWARIVASNPAVETLTIIEINPAYIDLIRERPEVGSVLSDPKVNIVIDDGRRWLKSHPEQKFDAVISNTTWHFRANVTNLLSREFIDLVGGHLKPGGIFYYNTTNSPRAQLTACQAMPHALRFTNHMVVSNSPIAVDFDRWRSVLVDYTIHGKRVLTPGSASDEAVLARLMGFRGEPTPPLGTKGKTLESCPEILARTEGMTAYTDDNMGTEWRRLWGLN